MKKPSLLDTNRRASIMFLRSRRPQTSRTPRNNGRFRDAGDVGGIVGDCADAVSQNSSSELPADPGDDGRVHAPIKAPET